MPYIRMDMQSPHDIVYKIYDPIENKFCSSGHGLYSRGRTIWNGAGAVSSALANMPENIRPRLVIKKYKLIEIEDK